jgi:hypothetical protein
MVTLWQHVSHYVTMKNNVSQNIKILDIMSQWVSMVSSIEQYFKHVPVSTFHCFQTNKKLFFISINIDSINLDVIIITDRDSWSVYTRVGRVQWREGENKMIQCVFSVFSLATFHCVTLCVTQCYIVSHSAKLCHNMSHCSTGNLTLTPGYISMSFFHR